jgi:hypothetical protein
MNPNEDCFANQIMADSIYSLLTNYEYDIFQVDDQSRERKISRFELNDMTGFVGNNYITLASIDNYCKRYIFLLFFNYQNVCGYIS